MTSVNWETVAAILAGILLMVLFARALVLLHLWVWHRHLKWPWQNRPETLAEHISRYNVDRGIRSGRFTLSDADLHEIEQMRRALAYHDERKHKGGNGSGDNTGRHSGSGGRYSGTTGFTAGTNYE